MEGQEGELKKGQRIYIRLINNMNYKGEILSITPDTITVLDKYNYNVIIRRDQILLMEVQP